jgi:HlyD family secretion protein
MKARMWWILGGAVVVLGGVAALALPALRGLAPSGPGQGGLPLETGVVTTGTSVSAVESSGAVAPLQSAELAWRTTGTVATVQVQVGDVVRAGQVLMTLDPASAPASVIQAQSELIAAQQALEDLLNPSQTSLANAEKAVADARAALEKAQRDVRSLTSPDIRYYEDQVAARQQALLTAQQNAEKTDLGSLAQAVEAARDDLETKTNQLSDARTAQEQCPGCTVLFINATGRRMSLADAEEQYNAAVNALRVAEINYEQAVASGQDAIKGAQEALDDAVANLAAAQRDPDALDLAQKRAALAVAEANLAEAEETLETLGNGADPDDVAAAENRILAARASVDALTLKAPFEGEVLAVNYLPGDPVEQTTPAVRLANRSRLHVNVSVDETEVSRVTVGDPVTVTVDAWPDLSLAGQVAAVQPFGETVQGLVRYTVRVDMLESDPRLYLNMTANASIVTEVRAEALAVPLDAILFDDQGEYVNRVMGDGTLERVNVVSGETDGDLVFVIGDLAAGDRVQLNAPAPGPEDRFPFGG